MYAPSLDGEAAPDDAVLPRALELPHADLYVYVVRVCDKSK